MYSLGTWFASEICVQVPCIKETMMMMMIIIIIIIISCCNKMHQIRHFKHFHETIRKLTCYVQPEM